jgi:DNA repair protein RadA/Sms
VYISGEESEGQVRLRFDRLKLETKHLLFSNTIDIGSVLVALEKQTPSLVIIDSIQTMLAEGLENLPGTPTSVRAATSQLIGYAKSTGTSVLIIGQVTKEGAVAGPKTLEHLVDTVLALEGDTQSAYRLLRVQKHRFGTVDELGVFEMNELGMVAVENPSAKFLEERIEAPGSAITCVIEGNRPFLVEIQALVEKSFFPNPIRRTTGFDVGRMHMLLAVLSKHVGVQLGEHDVYVNVVGGMKIRETAADLAVLTAVLSSYRKHVLPKGAVFVGEVGLSGELRSVPSLSRRLKEIERQGYKVALSSKNIKTVSEVFKKT